MRKSRLVIVNKRRFITSFSFILVILIILVSSIYSVFNKVEGFENIEYFEVYVDYGDTVWDIAKKYSPKNKDIRKTIFEISQINNINNYDIYPGMIIKVPKE